MLVIVANISDKESCISYSYGYVFKGLSCSWNNNNSIIEVKGITSLLILSALSVRPGK